LGTRANKKSTYKNQKVARIKKALANTFFLLCLVTIIYFLSTKTVTIPTFKKQSVDDETIYITEVATSSSNCYSTVFEEYYDWIEIYNPSDKPIKLKNYYISDKIENLQKYNLPDVDLKSEGYMIIYASGKNVFEDDEIHANFKLNSKGENLYLTHNGENIQIVDIPKIQEDFSYGINDEGHWKFLKPSSPLNPNGTGYDSIDEYFNLDLTPNGIYINEYMSKNQGVIYDENGEFGDWIEIINLSDGGVNLNGYQLSDDKYNPSKWIFPDIVLAQGETLLIFADSKSESNTDILHANFSLSLDDESIFLFDNLGALIDSIEIVETNETISYGRNKDNISKLEYFDLPTPGQINLIAGSAQKKTLNNEKIKYVYINEVKSTKSDDESQLYSKSDWIELYNNSDSPIDLSGFGLSDSNNQLYKWTFPDGTIINAHEYLLIIATGNNIIDSSGYLNTNFTINSGIEDIVLTSNTGYIIDKIRAKFVKNNNSFGKDASGNTVIFATPTPQTVNNTDSFLGYSHMVSFSTNSGCYFEPTKLNLSTIDPNSKIYYTLDGTKPTKNSIEYKSTITLESDSCIKAISATPNMLNSDIVINNYIFNKSHTLPIVMVSANNEYLYGEGGIIDHSGSHTQVPANIQIFEPNNADSISFEALIKIFGNTSRYAAQKSFAVEIESEDGVNKIEYDLFPADSKSATEYKSFVLRNGGSAEWNRTKLTDAAFMSLARLALNVDAQAYRPAAMYLNGQYYGLINIREKLNKDYLEIKYDLNRDTLNIVEPIPGQSYSAVQGSAKGFLNLVSFVAKSDMSKPVKYDYVKKYLDIDNYIDTILTHIILGNYDSGNLKFWKSNEEGSKWRAFLFDLDRAGYYASRDNFTFRTDPDGHGSGKTFDTSFLRGLLENDEFKFKFYKRAIELVDTVYSPEFSLAYYNYLASNMDTEMDKSLDLWWKHSYNSVSSDLYGLPPRKKSQAVAFVAHEQDRHRKFLTERKDYILKYIKSFFDIDDEQIAKARQTISTEQSPAGLVYQEFIDTGSIEKAIELSNKTQTVFR